MTAQYRPYRDEESVDGMEATSWTDNEPGSIQIYEKTTEELPFNGRKATWIQIALYCTVGILGFLLGYFGPFHQKDLLTHLEESERLSLEQFDLYEDPSIKEKLLTQIDGRNILSTLKSYQDTNRIPGSDADHELASKITNLFNEYGMDPITATNYTFKTMLPRRALVVKILDKDNRTLYSNIDHEHYPHEDMRPFLPLSQAEETFITTNQLLYINEGSKDDYAELGKLGLNSNDTEGKVLVIKQSYYQAHEVIMKAVEFGAKAVLLFPDPNLYGNGSPFPKSVQLPNDAGRSHPLAWSNYGDLASLNLTSLNGIDFTKLGAEKESKVEIPVIPISYDTAYKILFGLSGSEVPNSWNCFNYTLHVGPGYKEENKEDQRDKIQIEFYNHEATITTTTITGTITGAVEPDRYIILGSRRDSLNRGLLDSISGTAVMLEIARVYGLLMKQGWRPRRTIIFNSFGAESLNLIGSSQWLESHQRLLHSRAVAYINCDLVVTGNHTAAISASPLLYQVLYNSTKQVSNPNLFEKNQHEQSVYDAWKSVHHYSKLDDVRNKSLDHTHLKEKWPVFQDLSSVEPKLTKSALSGKDTDEDDIGTTGGGILQEYRKSVAVETRPLVRKLDLQSIYSPFFLYSGIPVVDVRYASYHEASRSSRILEDTNPLIGTKYDNLAAIQSIDPHLKYHVAVAQVISEILRDLSDSVFLPFNLLDYAVTLRDSYANLVTNYGNTFVESKVDLGK